MATFSRPLSAPYTPALASRDTQISTDADYALQLQIAETTPPKPCPLRQTTDSRATSDNPPSSDRKLAEELQRWEDESAAFVFLAEDMHTLELNRRKEKEREMSQCSSSELQSSSSRIPSEPYSRCRDKAEKSTANQRMRGDSNASGIRTTPHFTGYQDQNASHAKSFRPSEPDPIKTASSGYQKRSSSLRVQRSETNVRRLKGYANEGRIRDRSPPGRVRSTETSPGVRNGKTTRDLERTPYFSAYRDQNASHVKSGEQESRNVRAQRRVSNVNDGWTPDRPLPGRTHPTEALSSVNLLGGDPKTLGRTLYFNDFRDQNASHVKSSRSRELDSLKAAFSEYQNRSSNLRAQQREDTSWDQERILVNDEALRFSRIRQSSNREESTHAIAPVEMPMDMDYDMTLDWSDLNLVRGSGRVNVGEWELGFIEQDFSNNPPSRLADTPEAISTFDMLPGDETYEELIALSETIGPAKETGASKEELDRLPCKRVVLHTTVTSPPWKRNKSIIGDRDICVTFGSTCSICLSEYSHGDSAIVLTGCEHMFHAECLKAWLKNKKTCPIDRQTVAMNGK